jgi:hypothetical protein
MDEGWGRRRVKIVNKTTSGLYFLGFLGALVYYLQRAPTFWAGLVGIVKALFWPAILVYGLFQSLHL